MATVEECEKALHELAARLSGRDPSDKRGSVDRSLACVLRDLDVTFAGHLRDSQLHDVRQLPAGERAQAQIKLTMGSDDLVKLVDGELHLAHAWATGRVKIDAGVRDILRLRAIF